MISKRRLRCCLKSNCSCCSLTLAICIATTTVLMSLSLRRLDISPEMKQTGQRIPRVIHFTARTEILSIEHRSTLHRWLQQKTEGSTQFYLWRDVDAHCLARLHYSATKFPAAVKFGARSSLERSDLIRVLVLHYMGGLYMDLDTEPVKDLSPLFDYPLAGAMVATEPLEHAALLFGLNSLVSNAVMFSIPRHPFFQAYAEAIAENLLGTAAQYQGFLLRSVLAAPNITGPLVMQRVLDAYKEVTKSSCYSSGCKVHAFEPDAFSPVFDNVQVPHFRKLCEHSKMHDLSDIQLRVCDALKKQLYNQTGGFKDVTWAVHHFSHDTIRRQNDWHNPMHHFQFNALEEFPQLRFFSNEVNCALRMD